MHSPGKHSKGAELQILSDARRGSGKCLAVREMPYGRVAERGADELKRWSR
jgi:hypothetical protein